MSLTVIRLYIDQDLQVGQSAELADSELRYLKTVRRNQGEIELFNRQGQKAYGKLKGSRFLIENVETVKLPIYPITLAVGLPENSVIPLLIRSLSELGIESLRFFEGERSQKSRERLKSADARWARLAIEAARQCGRGTPLKVEVGDWRVRDEFSAAWFCDESESADRAREHSSALKNLLIVVGCEGGWTESERKSARDLKFEFVHFKTPILRVETAAVCAAFRGVQKCSDAAP